MLDTIATLNGFAREFDITEVRSVVKIKSMDLVVTFRFKPSLMNFCVTDGESVIATRYINSRHDEAASLVC